MILHEGRKNTLYKDSLGYLTIGVGHLLDPTVGGKLPEQIIDALLDWDINEKTTELLSKLPWINALDDVRKAVLIDMAFNLGVSGLLRWPIFLGQVAAGKYTEAAENMRQTKWASQVKSRADNLSKMMETGRWE